MLIKRNYQKFNLANEITFTNVNKYKTHFNRHGKTTDPSYDLVIYFFSDHTASAPLLPADYEIFPGMIFYVSDQVIVSFHPAIFPAISPDGVYLRFYLFLEICSYL